jgi:hypothetical protein
MPWLRWKFLALQKMAIAAKLYGTDDCWHASSASAVSNFHYQDQVSLPEWMWQLLCDLGSLCLALRYLHTELFPIAACCACLCLTWCLSLKLGTIHRAGVVLLLQSVQLHTALGHIWQHMELRRPS